MKPNRTACMVPFCRRTVSKEKFGDADVICGKHWRLGDQRWRRAYRKAWRKWKETGDQRYARLVDYCWLRVLRQATERAAGITG